MCGIGGAFGLVELGVTKRVAAALRHRGPDDAGVVRLLDRNGLPAGGFGHHRLAVLDLTPCGRQPMSTADGRLTISYNGEIYNFRELRDELLRAGATFRSKGDTEVILEGWLRSGPSFVRRLRGMFAFALWDSQLGRGYLVRDRYGIKPLYYAVTSAGVLFASELRAILHSDAVPRRLATAAVASYIETGSIAEPMTIVDGIHQLPAGTVAEIAVRDGRSILSVGEMFARPLEPAGLEPERDPAAAAHLVREALRDSVAHHLVSDVPVGVFLSGGIDSSTLVALATSVAPEPLETFTIVFAEEQYSEEPQAASVAARFRTRHRAIPLGGADLLALLPAAFAAMDQPSMDGLNTFVVSRAIREHGLKVVLSGLGGDELFAGYPSFTRARALARYHGVAKRVARVGARAAAAYHGALGEKLEIVSSESSAARAAYRASRVLFGGRQTRALVGTTAPSLGGEPPAGLSLLQQVAWFELCGYMRNTLLRDSDVFSMAHGLELRVPFVDQGVAAASMAVDDRLKLRRGRSKPLLLSAVAELLPREVWDRPKRGFTLPLDVWMRGPLRQTIQRELTGDAAERAGLSPTEVRRVWGAFERRGGSVSWSRPWALYTLVRWSREHDVYADAASSSLAPLAAAVG